MDSAHRAFIGHDLNRAEALYRDVAVSDSAPAGDRVEAYNRLAALAWRYRQEPDSGRVLLDRALALGTDSSATFAELSRLETANGRPEAATAAAEAALRVARTKEDRVRAETRLGAAAVAPALAARLDEGRRLLPEERARLEQAFQRLTALRRATPGLLEPSRLELEAALFLDDGAAALAAWRSYYLLHLERRGPLPTADDTLSRVLPHWAGPEGSAEAQAAAVRALAVSGQHDAALILATDPRRAEVVHAPGVADIVAYGQFLRDVRQLTDAYYRRTALGAGDEGAYRETLLGRAARLWEQLHWDSGPPALDEETFLREMARRFGAEVRIGPTAGYFDLHWGHAVVDEPRTVEQYGHRAEMRFLALDGLISNGFQSWAWDGDQAHGGWADENTIVQVRPGYAASPLRAWRALTDTVEVTRRREEHAVDSVADLERAHRNPYTYLPGLDARFFAQGLVQLRDSLAAEGLTGDMLRAAFLAAYDRARVESSIFAHEGRHAIDRRLDLDLEVWEREYRAKLSEVAFAPRPRLALRGGILSPNIGDDTPHGRANERIMRELVAWMDGHRDEVPDLDPGIPLLPQLSLLDDGQLRQVFRSLDPLAPAR